MISSNVESSMTRNESLNLIEMPLGNLTIEAFGDLANSSDVEFMIPNWYQASLVFERLDLIDTNGNYVPTTKTPEELIAEASIALQSERYTLPVLATLRDFAGSVTRLQERAATIPGDRVAAIRAAAIPAMRWGATEFPLHPAIVLAAIAALSGEPTKG